MLAHSHTAPRRTVLAIVIALMIATMALQPGVARADHTYVVEYGDTLSHIAMWYGTTVESLAATNGITNPHHIVTGQVLTIASDGPSQGAPSAAEVAEPSYGWDQPSAYVTPSPLDPDIYPPYFDRWLIHDLLVDAAHRYGWNPNLIKALAWHESYWRQDEVSWTGAIGVMQIMPSTAESMVDWYFGHDMNIWYSAYDNIEMGVAFLTVLYEETGSVELALASYYQGWPSIQRDGMFSDTISYVETILYYRDQFQAGNLP